MDKNSRILVAGGTGMVGSAIIRRLHNEGYSSITATFHNRRPDDTQHINWCQADLTDQQTVYELLEREKPSYVFLAAARVGGIMANATYPADFIRDNLVIQNNVIDAAYRNDTKKLCFLGSSCIYPKMAPQPLREEHLLTSELEPTNQWYAIAKIAGIKMCQAYRQQYGFNAISLMPTNLYGPADNFDLETSHVLPALIRKFHEAKERGETSVTLWGTGEPRREFLHVDDLADACLYLMNTYDEGDIVNIGTGKDTTINELAELIREVVGYEGRIEHDTSKPDGTPRKLLDISRLQNLGWSPRIGLKEGIQDTYRWYCSSLAT